MIFMAEIFGSVYIPKSGKKTPGVDWFWSGCASTMKKGLEILGISIVDADARDSIFLKAEQTFTEKKRGRKPKCTEGMIDPDSLTGWHLRMLTSNRRQLEFVFRDAKQFTGLTHCQARNSKALSSSISSAAHIGNMDATAIINASILFILHDFCTNEENKRQLSRNKT